MAASLFKWSLLYTVFVIYNHPGIGWSYKPAPIRHPLFVTVTEINHNAKDKTLEISCKIFTNDLEGALKKSVRSSVDLGDPRNKKITEQYIRDYITRHLEIKVDDKPVALQFVGSEKETDATWSYFQVTQVESVHKLGVTNTLLYESFDNELNIMHVTVGGNRKSGRLNNPESTTVFEF